MSKGAKMTLEWGRLIGEAIKIELGPYVEKIAIVGSVRRQQAAVGDVEVLYIPKFDQRAPEGEFFEVNTNLADLFLNQRVESVMLHKRLNINGSPSWGEKSKFAEYGTQHIPLDLFACTHETWVCNYLMRTGGKDNNMQIATAALKKGWEWQSTGVGFIDAKTKDVVCIPKSEAELFDAVGLPYLPPEQRR